LAFIEVTGVSKTFVSAGTTRPVLHDVTLAVEQGEFVAIVGSMGCGKSTLLNILAGLVAPDAGEVTVGGEAVRGVRKDAAIVFQNYSLLPWFSALQNVRLAVGAAFPDWSRDRQKEQAARYLAMVGLGNAMGRRPGQLSGGMRQRVAIARAFAIEPTLLFLDEPFGALDALTRGTLQQELARMCSATGRPVTTIMISNNVEEAILLADRIVPMTRPPSREAVRRGVAAGARLGDAVAVPLARPRSIAQLLHDEEAERVRAHVVESLTDAVSNHSPGISGDRDLAPARGRAAIPASPALAVMEND
jgi:nitrate/nitrite transport system ATP-binding protein